MRTAPYIDPSGWMPSLFAFVRVTDASEGNSALLRVSFDEGVGGFDFPSSARFFKSWRPHVLDESGRVAGRVVDVLCDPESKSIDLDVTINDDQAFKKIRTRTLVGMRILVKPGALLSTGQHTVKGLGDAPRLQDRGPLGMQKYFHDRDEVGTLRKIVFGRDRFIGATQAAAEYWLTSLREPDILAAIKKAHLNPERFGPDTLSKNRGTTQSDADATLAAIKRCFYRA